MQTEEFICEILVKDSKRDLPRFFSFDDFAEPTYILGITVLFYMGIIRVSDIKMNWDSNNRIDLY